MKPHIIVKGFIDVPVDELEIVKVELAKHIKLTLEEPGCVVFSIEQDDRMETRIHVYEEFLSIEDFNFHQDRIKNSSWFEASKNVKRHYEKIKY